MVSENLRDLMRRRRQELGISQEVVAERMGMSQEWTSKLERGGNKRALRTDVMILLADALEVPFDDVAVAAGITRTPQAARRILTNYYADSVAKDVDPEQRTQLAAIVRDVADDLLHIDEVDLAGLKDYIHTLRIGADIRRAHVRPLPPSASSPQTTDFPRDDQ